MSRSPCLRPLRLISSVGTRNFTAAPPLQIKLCKYSRCAMASHSAGRMYVEFIAKPMRDRDLRERQRGVGAGSLSLFSVSISVLPLCLKRLLLCPRERNPVIRLRLTVLRNDGKNFTGGLVASGRVEAHYRAIAYS